MIRVINSYGADLINDYRLSFKAKGLMYYLYAQRGKNVGGVNGLAKKSTDGATAIRNGLNELEKYGYLKRSRIRDEKGNYKKSVWDLDFDSITEEEEN